MMLTTLHVDKAKALVREALRRDPDQLRARTLSVLLALIDGDRSGADEQLAALVREDPESIDVIVTLYRADRSQSLPRCPEVGRQLMRHAPHQVSIVEAHGRSSPRKRTELSWPAYPMRRFGWVASGALWLLFVLSLPLIREHPGRRRWTTGVGVFYLVYVIYSWTYVPLLKRWLSLARF